MTKGKVGLTANSPPCATYRLQFSALFGFKDASDILGYLNDLGVTDIYASPLFRSGSQSAHGYDVCNYQEIDPKLGGPEAFEEFAQRLGTQGLGLLLDIVPNHMRADIANPWWLDVLEKGPVSPYASYFDIDWNSDLPNVWRKVLLPVLGAHYAEVLESGQIQLSVSDGVIWVIYATHRFPASLPTYLELFKETCLLLTANSNERRTVESLVTRCSVAGSEPKVDLLKLELRALLASSEVLRAALQKALLALNGTPGNPHSYDKLDWILQQQHYRLCWWRMGSEQIDYRRFFDVTELVCLNVQKLEVFDASHQLVRSLIANGIVRGLRVDHPDGLWSPLQYLSRLGGLWPASAARFVVVEKVLLGNEQLPGDWPVSGTTGYDFLNQVNGIFVDSSNRDKCSSIYKSFTGKRRLFTQLVFDCRLKVLKQSFSGQLESLVDLFIEVAAHTRYGRDFTLKSIRFALSNFIAAFPVYRTYVTEGRGTLSLQERRAVERAVRECYRRASSIDSLVLEFLRQILLLEFPLDFDDSARLQARRFIMKLQQLTAPLAAKGIEDTACYLYNRLISLNEVGGSPGVFGQSVEEFHRANQNRSRHWMHSLLATSTHDTKHGEDTRARINVLSEQPEEWESALRRWSAFNKGSKTSDNGNLLPSYNDEYRFYQALIGTWAEKHLANLDLYRIRMVEYMLKAVREAKEQTSWVDQDEGYENALKSFVSKVLSPGLDNRFLPDFRVFARRVSFFGYLNSLSQVLLKTVSPGVPDFYQGSELWDLALVDPDNRRPVDYQERQGLLTHLELQCARVQRHEFLQELCGDISNGAVKMFVMWRLLHFRRDYFRLFEAGRYLPCTVRGSKSAHVCSFARALDAHTVVAVAPRLISKLMNGEERLPQGLGVWGDTSITWPGLQEGSHFHEIFSDRALIAERYGDDAVLRVGDILTEFPIALLCSTP